MKLDNFDLYRNAILAEHPTATDIHEPTVKGSQQSVLMADTADAGPLVFKFSCKDLVKKNAHVSHLYKLRKIPVPQVSAREQNGLFFEEYPLIDGTTLHEAVNQGIGADQIRQVYLRVIDEFVKMSRMYPSVLYQKGVNHISDVARINTTQTNGKFVAYVVALLARLANLGCSENIGVYHSNITPKNIIVSDKGDFKAFVDLDSVCICNKNFALGTMAAKYAQLGLNINDLFNAYYKLDGQDLDTGVIRGIANADAAVKKILWYQSQKMRK